MLCRGHLKSVPAGILLVLVIVSKERKHMTDLNSITFVLNYYKIFKFIKLLIGRDRAESINNVDDSLLE